ncbi:P-loop containing nucleoside triphosphate hydrolase protein [Westerdykella ornata]|uniref:P-loop containing nucleoside triphosphate hydrolase protein n=1 Tax=Westerdykella ornata TaxID=318751 RepID=A0A6A6JAA6_WESOR|nr:P-loop containing nucleoside triphosphate hydrolase protein [Westerdykella ornata]KAF2273187.1 P-loop containing nucleoside triphosphate hydrolase protein [Westerdykella ornata]
MVLAKSKKSVGLGNALMNDRFGKGKNSEMHRGNLQAQGIKRTGANGETYVTNAKQQASWVKMRSVTEQGALDEFLSTAELAGTDFTAERINNVKIIHKDQKNPYLLSAAEERATIRKHRENRQRLTVPRRPHWDERTTPQELDRRERDSLMQWRRGLAELQENNDLLMTPFERNLEVWRQLWRVIERSDLVVQIVDARNPLLFRSEDLEKYVKEVDPKKNNLLLVNKADMMTLEQRQAWADYFVSAGINFKFFSAELAKEMNEARQLEEESEEDSDSDDHIDEDDVEEIDPEDAAASREQSNKETESQEHDQPTTDGGVPLSEDSELTRILTTSELEDLFLAHSPQIDTGPDGKPRKTQIGLVGYPNVGKSSTINALIGAKKVSVSATPGKTKHFQTIHLSDQVILCDCPGLVFPNFATTKAELVCSGVLPIDQLREYTGPAALVAQRIPQPFLEAIYGMKIAIRPLEEGGTGVPTAEELLRAYATARGFSTQGLGQPDESRAARFILKDYVKGKLLFCHPPPTDPPIDPKYFNRELYDIHHLPAKRRAQLSAHMDALSLAPSSSASAALTNGAAAADDDFEDMDPMVSTTGAPVTGEKTAQMDKKFFGPGQGMARITMPFHHQYSEQGRVKALSGRKAKTMAALERDVDPSELRMESKKHFKGNRRRGKQARGEYE